MKVTIDQLGLSIADGCNRRCFNCTHFSDFGSKKMLSAREAEAEMRTWSDRLLVNLFILYGGEPTLNGELTEITEAAAAIFPKTVIFTNGLLLHEHLRLKDVLVKTGTRLLVSQYEFKEFMPVLELLVRWKSEGVSVSVIESIPWTLRYRGSGKDITPFDDGDPQRSWNSCSSRWCFQLRDAKLWKCPHVACLPLVKNKHPELSPLWQPLLDYEPLSVSASDEQLREFVSRRSEAICGMCPAIPQRADPDARRGQNKR